MFDLECLCKYLWCLSPSCLISQVYSCHSAWKEIKVLPQGWFTCYTTTTDTAVYWSLFVLNILSLAVRQITLTKQRQLGQYRLWQSCLQVLVAYPCSIMSTLMLSCLFKTLCWVCVIMSFVWSIGSFYFCFLNIISQFVLIYKTVANLQSNLTRVKMLLN